MRNSEEKYDSAFRLNRFQSFLNREKQSISKVFSHTSDILTMGRSSAINTRDSGSPGDPHRDLPVTLHWDYDECTDRTASAFNWLSNKISQMRASKVILDMSRCGYMSVTGLHCLLEWNNDLRRQGIELRVTGLVPMVSRVFSLAKLEWILA